MNEIPVRFAKQGKQIVVRRAARHVSLGGYLKWCKDPHKLCRAIWLAILYVNTTEDVIYERLGHNKEKGEIIYEEDGLLLCVDCSVLLGDKAQHFLDERPVFYEALIYELGRLTDEY